MKNIYKMVKKGKFKLLSYIIEENLIYYKSLNKHKTLVAFLILEVEFINSILFILNDFLKKGFINYYSVQVDINELDKIKILINLEDDEKSKIIKIFNIINTKIINCELNARFLKNKHLEKQFLKILHDGKNSKIKVLKKNNAFLITTNNTRNIYEIYTIQLELLSEKYAFLSDFTKLIYNFKKKGFLILNFRMNYKQGIVFTPYFVNLRKQTEKYTDLGMKINDFFNQVLLKKQSLRLKSVPSLLWRCNFNPNYFDFTKFIDLFSKSSQYDFNNLNNFNSQFEQSLFKNHISYKRLNPNLLFINQTSLFITINKFDPQVLLKLFKKYHAKYFIFLLIFNEEIYEEVLKIDKIDFLTNIKVLNSEKFLALDLKVFKRKNILENPQIDGNILS